MAQSYKVVLISDTTGETVTSAVEAVTSQFPKENVQTDLFPFVRTARRAEQLAEAIANADLVAYTVADPQLSDIIEKTCDRLTVPAVPVLAPLSRAFSKVLGVDPTGVAGKQYTVDRTYLDRVSAIDYAISNDDGQSLDHLLQADVILLGVSRTSKTPTCIYLAYQGIRAANIPMVPGQSVPKAFFEALKAGVPAVGLVASPTRLSQVRQHRLKALGNPEVTTYADARDIQEELTEARLFFEKHGIPVIDVTRRSIEETAAAIRAIISEKKAE